MTRNLKKGLYGDLDIIKGVSGPASQTPVDWPYGENDLKGTIRINTRGVTITTMPRHTRGRAHKFTLTRADLLALLTHVTEREDTRDALLEQRAKDRKKTMEQTQ